MTTDGFLIRCGEKGSCRSQQVRTDAAAMILLWPDRQVTIAKTGATGATGVTGVTGATGATGASGVTGAGGMPTEPSALLHKRTEAW